MDIEQRFTVRHAPGAVWDALADPRFAVQCLPGAELDDSDDGRHYKGRMRVRLGPLSAAFAGDATVDRDPTARTGTVDWVGIDSRSNSRAKARMTYAVLPEGEGATAVQIRAEIALTGALAQFGRGSIVQDIAGRLTAMFAGNLQARLDASATPIEAAAPVAGEAVASSADALPPAPFKAAELRPLGLLSGVLRARIALLLRRWAQWLDPKP